MLFFPCATRAASTRLFQLPLKLDLGMQRGAGYGAHVCLESDLGPMHVRASRAGRGFAFIKRTFSVREIDSGAHVFRVVAARGLSCGASRRDSARSQIHEQLAAIAPADEHGKSPAVAAHSLWLEMSPHRESAMRFWTAILVSAFASTMMCLIAALDQPCRRGGVGRELPRRA